MTRTQKDAKLKANKKWAKEMNAREQTGRRQYEFSVNAKGIRVSKEV